jgi:hypothetical protein
VPGSMWWTYAHGRPAHTRQGPLGSGSRPSEVRATGGGIDHEGAGGPTTPPLTSAGGRAGSEIRSSVSASVVVTCGGRPVRRLAMHAVEKALRRGTG